MKSTAEQPPSTTAKADDRAGKYLSFRLGKEEFAIQVLRIREIMGLQEITAVPQTPPYLKGVINLRGRAIPLIDLKLKLGIPQVEQSPRTSIVVVHVESDGGRLLTGFLVDAVCEVLTLTADQIENAPSGGYETLAPYLLGLTKLKAKLRFLLDVNLILTAREIHDLEAVLV